MKITRFLLHLGLIVLVLAGLFLPAPPDRASGEAGPFSPSARQLLENLPADRKATFMITLRDQLTSETLPLQAAAALPGKEARRRAVIAALQAFARQQQAGLLSQARSLQAQGGVSRLMPFWIINGVLVEATPAAVRALAARPEVERVVPDPDPDRRIVLLDEGGRSDSVSSPGPESGVISAPNLTAASPEPNVAMVNAPALWALGYTGQGVVIASLDTGVDGTHPDLAPSYRGGDNSWFDPYGQNTTPTDSAGLFTGHGTKTMGLMVGGSAGGTAIGIAPGAQWIAAKIFNNAGSATNEAVHLSFQWVIASGADVVNNSWGYSIHVCDTTFEPDIQALLAAGILPLFAAGNNGPGPQTDSSPGNLPEAFAVGMVNNFGKIDPLSSRGPSACGPAQPFPHLVAPGVGLRSTSPGGSYGTCYGTSCATPEVSGSLALLLSAVPNLSPDLQLETLIQSAHHLTPIVPDSAYGYGLLDVLQAYYRLTMPLVVPGGLQAVAAPEQVDLTWTDTNANESGYEVQRSPAGQAAWDSLAITPVDATSYSDTNGLVEGTGYDYRVRAVNTSLGFYSDYVTVSTITPLLTPTGLMAAPFSNTQVNLYWTDHSALATGYEVQRSPDGLANWQTLPAGLPGTATSYPDTGLAPGTVYFYRVRATGSLPGSESAFTPVAQAVTGPNWMYVAVISR